MPTPVTVERIRDGESNRGIGLRLTWSDGTKSEVTGEILRRRCPCATCQERRGDTSHAQPLKPGRALLRVVEATSEEETDLCEVWPVGNYALGMRWADRHDSGIYSFSFLAELCVPAEE